MAFFKCDPLNSGANNFAGLGDVAVNAQTLTNGDVPVYNSTTQKWENSSTIRLGKMNTDGSNAASEVAFNGALTIGYRDSDPSFSVGSGSITYGYGNVASDNSFAGGENVITSSCAHAEGVADFNSDDPLTKGIQAAGLGAHAEGRVVIDNSSGAQIAALGEGSHAEGYAADEGHIAAGYNGAFATGFAINGGSINASADGAHAEGYAYGNSITASGLGAHAEGGGGTTASGDYSHAEGGYTTASGDYSHVEGYLSTASGDYSHVEGYSLTASGDYSHAEGYYTSAGYTYQHVQGKFNSNKSTTLMEIGNGTANNARSNAFEVYTDGSLSTNNGTTKTKLPVIKSKPLAANATSVTFDNMPSSGNNLIQFYTDKPGLDYTAITTSGTNTTLTYPAQSSSTTVYCSIVEVM